MMKSSTLFELDPSPPTSTLRPPDVIHVMGVQALPCFLCSSALYYTERKPKNKKTGEAWERG